MQDSDKRECARIAFNTFLIKHGANAKIARSTFMNEFKRSLEINNARLYEIVTAGEMAKRGASAKKAYLTELITYDRYIVKAGCECNGGVYKINMRRQHE